MKILYCEDEIILAEYVQKLLKASFNGCKINHYSDGLQAINHLKQDKSYDLILTDNMMPGAKGIDIYHYAVANDISVPLIIYSGDTILEKGKFLFVSKPFKDIDLIQTLKKSLERKSSLRESV